MIVRQISKSTGISTRYLNKVIVSASYRYKVYKIKKRNGKKRKIEHPARELKLIQTWLADNIFCHLPVHDSVYSYRKGRSVRDHANVHRRQNYLMRIDFINYFQSIKSEDIIDMLSKHINTNTIKLSSRDIKIISNIVCRFGNMTIGAPSSPVLSNAILFSFDKEINDKCKKLSIKYTRYADDLYFSTNKPNVLEIMYEEVRRYLNENTSPKLRINKKKTIYTSKKRLRKVTGLTLTSDNHISVGREKKRYIKSLLFKYINEDLKRPKISYLRGYISYIKSIEPTFYNSLENKYGKEKLDTLLTEKLYKIKRNK